MILCEVSKNTYIHDVSENTGVQHGNKLYSRHYSEWATYTKSETNTKSRSIKNKYIRNNLKNQYKQ